MYEVLHSMFDGNQHYIGETQHTFPQCKIVVTHRRLEPPTELTISIIGDSAVEDEERYKISDPDDATKRAIEVRARIQRSLYVTAPNNGEEGTSRKSIDQVWDLLYALFATQSTMFSAHGVFTPCIPILPNDIQSDTRFMEAYGTFKAELRSYFRPYSTGV